MCQQIVKHTGIKKLFPW
jgi:replicative superfamily II helicase